jgi:hypothetical protein
VLTGFTAEVQQVLETVKETDVTRPRFIPKEATCGSRIKAIIPGFQPGDGGSIPLYRSILMCRVKPHFATHIIRVMEHEAAGTAPARPTGGWRSRLAQDSYKVKVMGSSPIPPTKFSQYLFLSILFTTIVLDTENMSNTNRISSSTIKSMVAGESIKLSGVDRSEVVNTINAISKKNPGYQYNVTKNRKGEIVVKRVLPENKFDRAQYIASINKSTFKRILKQNDFVKTRTGEALGVSARTVGRLIQRHGI